jgi:PKD repeat protein
MIKYRQCRYFLLWLGLGFCLMTSCTLLNQRPVAVIDVSPKSGFAPLEVSMSGESSYDPDGIIVRYSWDFGDGTIAEGIEAQHIFCSTANYKVTLCVADDDGATGTAEAVVTVARLDVTGTWTGAIIEDEPTVGPFGLSLELYQQRAPTGEELLFGWVEWSWAQAYNVRVPITDGKVQGPMLEVTGEGLYSSDPEHGPFAWHTIHLRGYCDGTSIEGTGSFQGVTTFRWTAWKG